MNGGDPSELKQLIADRECLAELAGRLGQKALWRVLYAGGESRAIAARSPRETR